MDSDTYVQAVGDPVAIAYDAIDGSPPLFIDKSIHL